MKHLSESMLDEIEATHMKGTRLLVTLCVSRVLLLMALNL